MTPLYPIEQPSDIPATSGIYKIICLSTGKFYVGSSIDVRKRWRQHLNKLRSNKHVNKKLQNAWNKYTEQNFLFEIVELILPPFLLEREQYWIDKLRPVFNIAKSAKAPNLGIKASEEARAKLSARLMGNTYTRGKKRSPESIEKTRSANLGKKRSAEYCARSSAIRLGKKHSPETIEKIRLKKRNMSDETRAKLSASRKGKPSPRLGKTHTPEARAKMGNAKRHSLIVTSPEGITQMIFGIRPFCEANGLSTHCIIEVAQGKYRQHHGWTARYPTEEETAS